MPALAPAAAPSGTGTAAGGGRAWPRAAAVGAAIAALHLAVRLLVAGPHFLKYSLAAKAWLEGTMARERLVDFSPLLFQLSLALERWTGRPEAWIELLQPLLAGVAAAFLFRLAERRFGTMAGLVAAALFALDRQLLTYERIVEPELLLVTALLGLVVAAEAARPGWAGVAAALAVAARPSVLPIALVVPLYWRLREERLPGGAWRRATALFALPLVALAAALGWAAARATGSATAPWMSPGTVFFEGNRPGSRGLSAEYPPLVLALELQDTPEPDSAHVHYRRVARFDDGDPALAVAAVNGLWGTRAVRFVADHPGDALGRLRRKLFYALHGRAWNDVIAASSFDERLRQLPTLPFSLVAALGIVGMLVAARRWRESLLVFAVAFGQLGVLLVFYVSARQRIVLLPALALLAAAAVHALASRRTAARMRWAGGALALLLLVALSIPDEEMRRADAELRSYSRAESAREVALGARRLGRLDAFAAQGELTLAHGARWLELVWPASLPGVGTAAARAAGRLEAALGAEGAPTGAEGSEARLDLARLWLEAEEPRRAVAALGPEEHQRARGAGLLARALALGGGRAGALEVLRAALARHPEDAHLLAELAALAEAPEAQAARARLERYFGRANALFLVGEAQFAHHRPAEAARELEPLARAFPDLHRAQVRLAIALGESGELERGMALLEHELRARPEPLVSPARAAAMVAKWRAAHADDPRATALADGLDQLLGVAPPA